MNSFALKGCTPEPLINYLKSLGILKLVVQKDKQARGYWQNGYFILKTSLERQELLGFFLNEYQPTPILAPWNGGSGFWGYKTATDALENIRKSTHKRLMIYRQTIDQIKTTIVDLGLKNKPEKQLKTLFLRKLRSTLPEETSNWIDALCVLDENRADFSPLLGSGGNDGNMDFSGLFMQRLAETISFTYQDSDPLFKLRSVAWLESALFNEGNPALASAAVGQFNPGGVGGPNATFGFEGDTMVNPWDYILMLEGTLLFAGSISRRTGRQTARQATFPFTVYASSGGWQTVSNSEALSARSEIWLPLWERPALLVEIEHLMMEGRAQVEKRAARTGSDFVRAVSSLGVERGISSFSRFCLARRKGQGYIAVPLGQFDVTHRSNIHLLNEADPWLERLRRIVRRDNCPSSIRLAHRRIEDAIFRYCQNEKTENFQEILIAIANTELQICKNRTIQKDLAPIPLLSPDWLQACDDGSHEFRLARSLAFIGADRSEDIKRIPMRCYIEPVSTDKTGRYIWKLDSTSAVWSSGHLSSNLIAVLKRIHVDNRTFNIHASIPIGNLFFARLDDVQHFINGQVDDHRIGDLLRGLALIRGRPYKDLDDTSVFPYDISRLYATCKLLYHHNKLPNLNGTDPISIPSDLALIRKLQAGDTSTAVQISRRRLSGAGIHLIGTGTARRKNQLPGYICSEQTANRIAAALVFPISSSSIDKLVKLVVPSQSKMIN